MWKNKHTQDALPTPDLVWMSRLTYVPRRCVYKRKKTNKQVVKVYIVSGQRQRWGLRK